jgi:hypothetical protein
MYGTVAVPSLAQSNRAIPNQYINRATGQHRIYEPIQNHAAIQNHGDDKRAVTIRACLSLQKEARSSANSGVGAQVIQCNWVADRQMDKWTAWQVHRPVLT